MIVVAVDPGETCGWAMVHLLDDWARSPVSAGQATADDWCDWVDAHLDAETLLAVESFTVTSRTAKLSPQPRPIEVIGVMKFLARKRDAKIVLQSPSAAKRFATDAQLRKAGLWQPGQDHARDAIRHLLLAISVHGTGRAREELLQSLV